MSLVGKRRVNDEKGVPGSLTGVWVADVVRAGEPRTTAIPLPHAFLVRTNAYLEELRHAELTRWATLLVTARTAEQVRTCYRAIDRCRAWELPQEVEADRVTVMRDHAPLCPCGCGRPVTRKKYAAAGCRQRVYAGTMSMRVPLRLVKSA